MMPLFFVTAAIALFNGSDLTGWETYIKGHGVGLDPDKVFSVGTNGSLVVSGNGFGYIRTKAEYSDYRLSFEYRWCGRAWGPRLKAVADSGVLFHATGEDGAIDDMWMRSFEMNIIVGRTGDLIVVGNQGENLYRAKGMVDSINRWCESGGEVSVVDTGRINSRFHLPELPSDDTRPTVWPESAYGEWNKVMLVCCGETAEFWLNGKKVNEVYGLTPTKGKILFQTEGHGIEYRNVMLENVRHSEPYGNWAFEAFGANWLGIRRLANGKAQASVLWWGAPEDQDEVRIDGSVLLLRQQLCKDGVQNPNKVAYRELRGIVVGDAMSIEIRDCFADGRPWGDVVRSTARRVPPVEGPAPDLSRLEYGEPIDLFESGLDGWDSVSTNAYFGWHFSDGILSNDVFVDGVKKRGANIATRRTDFYDFTISYDVLVPAKSNSGVYLRGRYEIQAIDSYAQEADTHSMGTYYGRYVPLVRAEKPAGEWQHVEATLFHRHLTVFLNGKKIVDACPVVGITGGAIDSNDFVSGPIMIQGDHSNASYKNMVLRPIRNAPE